MKNKNLIIVSFVMFINALSYGTIIPLMYPYASKFGITASGMSILFASFSLAQFISTPLIGRLSDKYGRKPLLLLSLFGTSISLLVFALAQSALVLFIARILDGITGGNISVAQAIIADSTSTKDRAKSFGILGALFGFGFTFGPAIGGFLSTISLSAPFLFASALAFIGTIMGWVILTETNTQRETKSAPLFDIKSIGKALFEPLTGTVLAVSFVSLIAMNAFIIGFQSFTVDILSLSTTQIGLIFTLYGFANILTQGFGIKLLLDKVSSRLKIIRVSLLASAIFIVLVAFSNDYWFFVITVLLYGVATSPVNPVITALISERTNPEDQGGILGINQAYTSLAQIIGPLITGVVVLYSVPFSFLVTGILLVLSLVMTRSIRETTHSKLNL